MAEEKREQADDIRQLMIETARVQVASLNAGIVFWTGWVERTAAFAKLADQELLALSQQKTDANEVISRLVDSSREYLQRITELPALAVSEFTGELGKSASKKNSRRRSARAKP